MPAASSLSVLIVDDQMTILSLVRSGLQQIGCSNIEEAADGEQGLRNLIARPANLVITDFNMPKLDGLGLLGFESVLNRDYPVVFGTLFIFSLVGLVVNLLSDLAYMWVDPRIDFEAREV